MRKRSTIDVDYVRDTVNSVLRNSGNNCPKERRQGMMNILEDILHSTGNYKGFKYLSRNDVPFAADPGVNLGFENDYDARFAGTDRTRVEYF